MAHVISVQDLRGSGYDPSVVLPRTDLDQDGVLEAVKPIIAEVREGGVDAILRLTERFDGVRPKALRVSADEVKQGLAWLTSDVRASLELAIDRVGRVHREQRRESSTTTFSNDEIVTTRWLPVDRVGLYVPGGKAVYPSSVVMNVVPAMEAGVRSLAIASPPQHEFDGLPHPAVLGAAALLGVDEIYAVGGAQAMAMFAYGARDSNGSLECQSVDLVTGPGNPWVTAAKRLLRGKIGTDAEAGPTEVMILADDSADPHWVAADLISQAEHDPLAAAVLVTTSSELADAVESALEEQVNRAHHADRIREALRGSQSGILVVDGLDDAVRLANAYAAEHLEIHTKDARQVADRIRNAGAVFVGPYSPVSLGDYCAGSNHVLPTSGGAAHAGALSVQTFLKCSYVVEYGKRGLNGVARSVATLAEAENLPAHGEAVLSRFASGATG